MKIQHWLLALGAAGGLGSVADAQVFQLAVEDCVRQDDPRLQPRLDWIRDEPRPIDKQSFRNPTGTDYTPETVFVRFLPGTVAEGRAAAHARAAIDVVLWQSRLVPDLYLVRTGTLDVVGTVNAYLDDASTLYSEPNYRSRSRLDPDDPMFSDTWGMGPGNGSYASWAWDELQGSQDFVVAIIDSAIDAQHPDLASNMWVNPGESSTPNGNDDDGNGFVDDRYGWDFSDMKTCVDPFGGGGIPCGTSGPGDNDPSPGCSPHGTHVAGTVGARGNNGQGVAGVMWRCKLMNLKCESPGQTPGDCNGLSNTVLALDYAVANGARVSNNSYGSPDYSQAQDDEILASQAFGHIVVAAAGNDGTNNDVTPQYPASLALDNIISVANTDDDGELYDGGLFSSGSNYGATTVDLGAPGTDVLSTVLDDDYEEFTGTSMAAPHVAGAVGLVWARDPSLEWWKVTARILDSTTPEPTLSGKTVTGGRLNAQRAVGVWVSPAGGTFKLGTFFNPFSMSSSATEGFPKAYSHTPEWGFLNMIDGEVPFASLPAGFGSKPMTLRAAGGSVRLGIL